MIVHAHIADHPPGMHTKDSTHNVLFLDGHADTVKLDATNTQRDARARLVKLAREHDVLPVAIVLDVPQSVAAQRNARRPDRTFGSQVIRRQHDQLRRSLKSLSREGFRGVHVLRGVGMGLDEKAVAAVQQYRFKPATQNGKPVAVYLNVEVNFQIF